MRDVVAGDDLDALKGASMVSEGVSLGSAGEGLIAETLQPSREPLRCLDYFHRGSLESTLAPCRKLWGASG